MVDFRRVRIRVSQCTCLWQMGLDWSNWCTFQKWFSNQTKWSPAKCIGTTKFITLRWKNREKHFVENLMLCVCACDEAKCVRNLFSGMKCRKFHHQHNEKLKLIKKNRKIKLYEFIKGSAMTKTLRIIMRLSGKWKTKKQTSRRCFIILFCSVYWNDGDWNVGRSSFPSYCRPTLRMHFSFFCTIKNDVDDDAQQRENAMCNVHTYNFWRQHARTNVLSWTEWFFTNLTCLFVVI